MSSNRTDCIGWVTAVGSELGQTGFITRWSWPFTYNWLAEKLFQQRLWIPLIEEEEEEGARCRRIWKNVKDFVLDWKKRLMMMKQTFCAKRCRYLCSRDERAGRRRTFRLATGLSTPSDDKLMPWPIPPSTRYYPTPSRPTISARSTGPSHSHARVLRRRLQ